MASEKLAFVGVIVSPISLNELSIAPGYLLVRQGKIVGKGTVQEFENLENSSALAGYRVVRLTESQFLLPGLIDCHLHAPQFPNIGLGLDKTLLEWLDKYTFPLESKYGDVEFAKSVYDQVVKRLLINGTTTACYFGSIHLSGTMELAKSVLTHGQRALVGKVSMNVKNDAGYYNDTDKELEEVESFVTKVLELQSELVKPVISPRFALSCDTELMRGLARISEKYGCRIQSHISENLQEIEQVLQMNPDCASYAEVYDKCGLLNNRCILAHAVHVGGAEMALASRRGTSVAHCPASNTRLRSGLCPVRALLNCQLAVGLGTDVSGGDSASILDAMRRAMDVSTHRAMLAPGPSGDTDEGPLTWREALYLATLGGARALGLEDKIGSLEVGKSFDALLVDAYAADGPIDRYEGPMDGDEGPKDGDEGPTDRYEGLVQRFVYLGDDRNIAQVFVEGRPLKNCS